MYRTNAQSRVFEKALLSKSIRYRLIGGVRFYDRREVKDVLCFLRLLCNPNDAVSFERALDVFKLGNKSAGKGAGNKTVLAFENWMKAASSTSNLGYLGHLFAMLDDPYSLEDTNLNTCMSTAQIKAMTPFAVFMKSLYDKLLTVTIADLMKIICEEVVNNDYFIKIDKNDFEVVNERASNVQELITAACRFKDNSVASVALVEFLEEAALLSENEAPIDPLDGSSYLVTLMTIHASKGVEFDLVTVAGVEEGLLPLIKIDEEDNPEEYNEALDEENRLLYVASTRAKYLLYISHRQAAFQYGTTRRCNPSRFLRPAYKLSSSVVIMRSSKYFARLT
jgi:DNA helicase II / ATP-dependent DNA helicase PcrA